MAKLCQVCTTGEVKYKCPACRAPYCSAACYKKHKEVPCAAPPPPTATNASAASAASAPSAALASANGHHQQQHPQQPSLSAQSKNPEYHEELVLDTAQFLSTDQLEALRALPIVQTSVENPTIRALLTKIDTSGNRLKELEKALLDPTFASFMYQTLDQVHAKAT